jgi:hypothetical protein
MPGRYNYDIRIGCRWCSEPSVLDRRVGNIHACETRIACSNGMPVAHHNYQIGGYSKETPITKCFYEPSNQHQTTFTFQVRYMYMYCTVPALLLSQHKTNYNWPLKLSLEALQRPVVTLHEVSLDHHNHSLVYASTTSHENVCRSFTNTICARTLSIRCESGSYQWPRGCQQEQWEWEDQSVAKSIAHEADEYE